LHEHCTSNATSNAQAEGARDEITPSAEEIYAEYPKKVAKNKALMAIRGALRVCSAKILLERTILYAEVVHGSESRFIPYPASWFNGQRFNDDPSTWRIASDRRLPLGANTQRKRENRINSLNRRKAELMRLPHDDQGNLVDHDAGRELHRIQMELSRL
jgi:hypothetical protein